ncbi:hypothetical protein Q9966_015417 [Columba livia]|nr:hypothetical protein Q9966_015417 [Columba livia]
MGHTRQVDMDTAIGRQIILLVDSINISKKNKHQREKQANKQNHKSYRTQVEQVMRYITSDMQKQEVTSLQLLKSEQSSLSLQTP